MRIATANAYDGALDTLTRQQAELSQVQAQISSQKRVARGSDDPAAAARAERALAGVARTEANQRALDASRNATTQVESALGDATDLLQQAREALVASGNASYSDAERLSLAAQIRSIRAQLFAVANRDDGAGGYLFGGQGSSAPPFVDAPGGVRYAGTAGTMVAADPDGMPLATDGGATWLAARTGNGVFETAAVVANGTAWIDAGRVTQPSAVTGSTYTIAFAVAGGSTTYSILKDGNPTAQTGLPYTSGQAIEVDGESAVVSGQPADGDTFELRPSTPSLSVFDVLDRVAAQLATTGRNGGQIQQATSAGLRDVDAVLSRLSSARSAAGDALNRIDAATGRLDAQSVALKAERSSAEDLDMVQAISDFQTRQTGYDAALKAYSMVQRLSLFQYLGP
ncbi:MAG TPA: flagellar hook-associated protein FlgL [Ideonella sp.]|nr:flagellar hook-associated protein FlgL [Ideonella sp.]